METRHFSVIKCDALRDLIPFVQFKKVKNIHGGVILLVKLQAIALTLLSLLLLHVCVFLRFLNCTNGTKSECHKYILIFC